MVTGPANFPTRRNQKANEVYDRANNDLVSWSKKTLTKLENRFSGKGAISSDDPDAVSKLTAKIAEAEANHAHMKAVNKIAKKKGLSDPEKKAKLAEIGVSEKAATDLLSDDLVGRKGYASYQLTNNNANINRMKGRLEDLEKESGKETSKHEFSGGTVVDNKEKNRVQIVFDSKPDADMRTKLKGNGFKWSPKEEAWQRKRNNSARYAVSQVLGHNPFEAPEITKAPGTEEPEEGSQVAGDVKGKTKSAVPEDKKAPEVTAKETTEEKPSQAGKSLAKSDPDKLKALKERLRSTHMSKSEDAIKENEKTLNKPCED
jgi:hypothetical protein